jgi:hypothetical protein
MAGMGVALLAERHLRPGMEIINIVKPPNIVFVVRSGSQTSADHLAALRDDISHSLST